MSQACFLDERNTNAIGIDTDPTYRTYPLKSDKVAKTIEQIHKAFTPSLRRMQASLLSPDVSGITFVQEPGMSIEVRLVAGSGTDHFRAIGIA